jgi:hypothetical protein
MSTSTQARDYCNTRFRPRGTPNRMRRENPGWLPSVNAFDGTVVLPVTPLGTAPAHPKRYEPSLLLKQR